MFVSEPVKLIGCPDQMRLLSDYKERVPRKKGSLTIRRDASQVWWHKPVMSAKSGIER
jgi:hypothetical protein